MSKGHDAIIAALLARLGGFVSIPHTMLPPNGFHIRHEENRVVLWLSGHEDGDS